MFFRRYKTIDNNNYLQKYTMIGGELKSTYTNDQSNIIYNYDIFDINNNNNKANL